MPNNQLPEICRDCSGTKVCQTPWLAEYPCPKCDPVGHSKNQEEIKKRFEPKSTIMPNKPDNNMEQEQQIELDAIKEFPMNEPFGKTFTGIDIVTAKREAWVKGRKASVSLGYTKTDIDNAFDAGLHRGYYESCDDKERLDYVENKQEYLQSLPVASVSLDKKEIASKALSKGYSITLLCLNEKINLIKNFDYKLFESEKQIYLNSLDNSPEPYFYCQRKIEENPVCKQQCDHCKSYYAPLQESLPEQKDKVYNIEFAEHVMAGIKVSESGVEVIGAVDGWGNGITMDRITITEQP